MHREFRPIWVTDSSMVRERGVEPLHPYEYTDLNRARLPIPPLALKRLRLARCEYRLAYGFTSYALSSCA